ncbi:MAG TPA: hypothetical protein DGT21_17110 [Armatimonadetes bacterium]|nr:hypothetical protein [Armatimonadota bacterium]
MSQMRRSLLLCAVALTAALASCTSCSQSIIVGPVQPQPQEPRRPQFDRAAAFADLEAQCAFGARVPGSQAHEDCAAWIEAQLRATTSHVVVQEYSLATPFGGPYDFTNLIAYYPGDESYDPVMIGAHWDCRPVADADPNPSLRTQPVMGANDGASGVAVLLEIARKVHNDTHHRPLLLAFFDAEDSGKTGASGFPRNGWALGSNYMANHMPQELPTPAAVIVIDLVGQDTKHNPRLGTPNGSNDYLDFPLEGHSLASAPLLVDEIWTIGEQAGHTAFVRRNRGYITDDHLPFIDAGFPAIDIIDLPHPEWHTADDTPDCCSADSLYQIGDTLMRYLYPGIN